jgi:DNA-binding NarL/FixJ family response regulator
LGDARLGISDQTVKFHVAAICGKLGAANRTDRSVAPSGARLISL